MSSSTGSERVQTNSYVMFSWIILLVFAGTVDTISKKTLNINHSLGKKFKHAFFVSFLMFLGEVTALIFYYLRSTPKQKNKEISEKDRDESGISQIQIDQNVNVKPELSIWMLTIPAFFDFMATTLGTVGLTMMSGSAYQMMRGSSILFVVILSRFYLKSRLHCFHYFAIFLVMSGLMLIGSANIIIPPKFPANCPKSEVESSSLLGYILVFFASFFVAAQITIEEEFTKNYNCHPLKAVGWEGVFGSILYLFILVGLQQVHCEAPPKGHTTYTSMICTQNDKGEWRLEDSIFAVRQNFNSGLLFLNSIIFCLSVALINFAGVTVTKIASAGARSITEPIRTISIWAFFMLPIVNHCHRESFNIVQFIGFILLILGNLIYNQVIIIPGCRKIDGDDLESSKITAIGNYQTIPNDAVKNEKC